MSLKHDQDRDQGFEDAWPSAEGTKDATEDIGEALKQTPLRKMPQPAPSAETNPLLHRYDKDWEKGTTAVSNPLEPPLILKVYEDHFAKEALARACTSSKPVAPKTSLFAAEDAYWAAAVIEPGTTRKPRKDSVTTDKPVVKTDKAKDGCKLYFIV